MGTVPVPFDWAANAGAFASAAVLEAGVGDVLSFLLNPPKVQVRRTTAQSIPNITPTAILFDTEDDPDNDAMHSTVTNTSRVTCNTPGRYEVCGAIPYDTGTTGTREARIVKNGSGSGVSGGRVLLSPAGGTGIVVVTPVIEVPMVAGDFLELHATHTNGAALTTTAVNSLFPIMRVRWVGP